MTSQPKNSAEMALVANTLSEPHMRNFIFNSLQMVQEQALRHQVEVASSLEVNNSAIAMHYCYLQGQSAILNELAALATEHDSVQNNTGDKQ